MLEESRDLEAGGPCFTAQLLHFVSHAAALTLHRVHRSSLALAQSRGARTLPCMHRVLQHPDTSSTVAAHTPHTGTLAVSLSDFFYSRRTKGINRARQTSLVSQGTQHRPESSSVTITWRHASRCKVQKLHQRWRYFSDFIPRFRKENNLILALYSW